MHDGRKFQDARAHYRTVANGRRVVNQKKIIPTIIAQYQELVYFCAINRKHRPEHHLIQILQ